MSQQEIIEVPYPYAFKYYAFGTQHDKSILIKADTIEKLNSLAELHNIDITDFTVISPNINIFE